MEITPVIITYNKLFMILAGTQRLLGASRLLNDKSEDIPTFYQDH